MKGTLIPVEVATHVAGTLEFESGAVVSIAMSFDVPKHRHLPIEIYGDKGAMLVPDPNKFGGEVQVWRFVEHPCPSPGRRDQWSPIGPRGSRRLSATRG